MPFADAKYPLPTSTEAQVHQLLEALEPFAFLLENPLDEYEDKERLIATADLIHARMVFCRVAVALRLPGYGGDA